MFRLEGGRPGDARGFLHKRLIGLGTSLVKRLVPPVAIASDLFGAGRSLFGRKRPSRATIPRTQTARPSIAGEQGKALGRDLKFGGGPVATTFGGFGATTFQPTTTSRAFAPGGATTFRPRSFTPSGPCDFPMVRDKAGNCRTPTSGEFGGEQFGVGEAVMGQFGAALQPGSQIIDRAICLPGMQLGKDGLCYNKGAITNSQRMWPRGRRPLLTGGDMRAIGIAARAGSKLDRTTKRLRSLGLMKALPKARGAPKAHAHAKPVAAVSV